jgi:hypothetical protein
MTTRLAELVPTVVLTSWNDAGHLKAFAGGPRNNRLVCRERTRARSGNLRLATRPPLPVCGLPAGR